MRRGQPSICASARTIPSRGLAIAIGPRIQAYPARCAFENYGVGLRGFRRRRRLRLHDSVAGAHPKMLLHLPLRFAKAFFRKCLRAWETELHGCCSEVQTSNRDKMQMIGMISCSIQEVYVKRKSVQEYWNRGTRSRKPGKVKILGQNYERESQFYKSQNHRQSKQQWQANTYSCYPICSTTRWCRYHRPRPTGGAPPVVVPCRRHWCNRVVVLASKTTRTSTIPSATVFATVDVTLNRPRK